MKIYYYKGIEYLIDEIDIKRSIEAINNNKKEFDLYISTNAKLGAVKALKEYAKIGLREAKQILELIWDNQISLINVKEERQKKLEKLTKLPLINEMFTNFKKINDEDIGKIFEKLTIDELLKISEIIEENLINK